MFVTNMDHFNATVLNGNLVSMRRGLQVCKTKHQGIQFINTSAASDDASNPNGANSADLSRPLERRMKFVGQPKEPRKGGSKHGKGSAQGSQHDTEPRERRGRSPKEPQESVFSWESSTRGSPENDVFYPARFDEASRIPRSPIPWLNSWMGKLSENEQRLVHLYLRIVPTKMYPYEQILEHNPVRSSAFLEKLKSSDTSLSCVIMTASNAETFLRGEWASPELLYYVSKVCSLVNGRLSDRTMKREFDQGILECVASMAMTGWNVGRYDHWHLHMKGLKQLIELEGGMKREWGYLLNKIRRADVQGAAHLGLLPYLDYPRFFEAPTNALPYQLRSRIVEEVSAVLTPCRMQLYLVNAIASASLFAGILRMAFVSPNREVLLHPEAFIEEWLWCEYQLVWCSGPLRSDCENTTLGEPDELTTAADLGSSDAVAAAMVRNLHTIKPIPSPADNLLEPALRTAALVYLEILVPDEPRNPMSHAVPLNLLSASVRKIVQKLQERQSRKGRPWEDDDDDDEDNDGLPHTDALRPIMIWVCLVGSVVSKLCEMDLVTMGIVFDRGCYGQCLSMLVGPEPEHVDLLPEQDLALCRLLDARGMRLRQQDERVLLKDLLREHAYGVPLLDLAYV
ncbi:uncharacterized protein CTRU02_213687 [Colletotrichum truncatum]|uniref:Uncharacterized protein n=1 Tax=Colletotrichum truncatum TaxID=5467 RepID=A0ACC3YGG1_COLTU|nr:uncharacterized protein CTRU02_11740 [Colletotrichum truncatum]KAF6785440.1 hypothetical protein CTRU02_11740 [Colletotrichum truncatum]